MNHLGKQPSFPQNRTLQLRLDARSIVSLADDYIGRRWEHDSRALAVRLDRASVEPSSAGLALVAAGDTGDRRHMADPTDPNLEVVPMCSARSHTGIGAGQRVPVRA